MHPIWCFEWGPICQTQPRKNITFDEILSAWPYQTPDLAIFASLMLYQKCCQWCFCGNNLYTQAWLHLYCVLHCLLFMGVFSVFFYRAMHFSAKRGIAIACRLSVRPSIRPSVCLSVTLVNCDHIGWNSLKIISPLVSLACSLFATPTWRVCSKGNTPKFGPKVTHPPVDLSDGDIRSQIAAEWFQIAQRSQWRAYRKLPSLFLMVSSLTPYDLPFSPKWGSICPQHTRMAISLQRVIRYTSCLVLG